MARPLRCLKESTEQGRTKSPAPQASACTATGARSTGPRPLTDSRAGGPLYCNPRCLSNHTAVGPWSSCSRSVALPDRVVWPGGVCEQLRVEPHLAPRVMPALLPDHLCANSGQRDLAGAIHLSGSLVFGLGQTGGTFRT
jgi:hypothetical protein